jgi:uncharacterized heparinase superfamily protein
MSSPASPSRPTRAGPTSEQWRANPFHRMRLGEAAPECIEGWGRDPRMGDAERGREIGRGLWRIGAERISGEHASPWDRAHPSRHFSARLHSFSWLVDLASVGPSADARIAELIHAWVAESGEWDDLAWDPELTAERLFAWLCWGRPAFEHSDPARRTALMRSAARQSRLLMMATSELNERHLGSIKAGVALVLAAAAGFPDADKLVGQGEELLMEACAKQFYPDGGHYSRSPEAMVEALCDLVTAHDVLAELDEPPPILRELLPKLANMVRMLRLGDGALGCFHGGSENQAPTIESALARSPGETRAPQYATHSAFQRLEAGALRILFDVGGAPPSAYSERAHASALAFEMSSETERLIVNVGSARELEPFARQAARMTNAHSTLSIGDAVSAQFEDARRAKAPPRLLGPQLDEVRRSSDDSGITVQGRHDGYKAQFGLLHRRYLFVDHDGKNLRGIDELIRPMKLKSPNPKAPIPFAARFHLYPNVRARMIEQQVAVLETPGGQRWRLRTDAGEMAVVPSIYWGGKPVPQESLQIVLSGAADPMGHGLAPPNRLRWALQRVQ